MSIQYTSNNSNKWGLVQGERIEHEERKNNRFVQIVVFIIAMAMLAGLVSFVVGIL